MNTLQIVAASVCALIFIVFVILSIVANRMLNSTFVPSSPLWKKLDLGKIIKKNCRIDTGMVY